MYCIECGTRNPDEAKFCKQCGRRMETRESAEGSTAKPVPAAATPEAAGAEETAVSDAVLDPVARYKELLALAFRHYDNGEYEAAKVACSGALAIKPESTDAHALLSTVYERLGDRDTAIAEREKVLALNPASIADREKLEALRSGVAQVVPRKILSSHRPDPTFWDTPAGAAVAAVTVTLLVVIVGYAVTLYRERSAPTAPPIQPGVGDSSAATRPPTQEPTPAMGNNPGLTQSAPQQPPPQNQTPLAGAGAVQPGYGNAPTGLEPLPVRPNTPPLVESPRNDSRRTDNGFFDPGSDRGAGQPPASPDGGARPPANPGRIEIVVQPPGGSSLPPSQGGSDGPRMESRNHAEVAMDLQMKGDYKRAAQAWERALDGAGDDRPGLHQKAAMCYQRLNDPTAARRHFTEAIRGFREQIAAGKDVDRAKAAIQACEAGLGATR